MSEKRQRTQRDDYSNFSKFDTRWADNDVYGHVNNVVYYAYFDSAVNRYLIEHGVLDIAQSPIIGLVVETHCTYFSSIRFPDSVHVGMKVVHLGTSSVRYEIAIFGNDEDLASAVGSFVHVYVDRANSRPMPIPDSIREALRLLVHER